MQTHGAQGNSDSGKMSSAVSSLVMAELLLVQATIESATALGGGLSKFRFNEGVPIKSLLQATRDEALEPYTSRFKYLRELLAAGSETTTTDSRN